MKPMLLCRENPNIYKLPYPLYVSYKLDGIRCCIVDGKPKSRTLKDIPNKHIQSVLGKAYLEGLDGELIVGDPTSKSVYRDTNSFVMAHDKVGDFTYYIFDQWNNHLGYEARYFGLQNYHESKNVVILPSTLVSNSSELLAFEEEALQRGFEGLIIRCLHGSYKFGRTTMGEQNTYKLKRFEDSEAVIIGFEEEMHNGNEATTNELGHTKRQTLKAGMSGKGTLGALILRDLVSDAEFKCGSGFDASDRSSLWNNREFLLERIVKYKFFPIGVKDKPRHPIFLGFRDKMDM
jgi:DNA ligase-1